MFPFNDSIICLKRKSNGKVLPHYTNNIKYFYYNHKIIFCYLKLTEIHLEWLKTHIIKRSNYELKILVFLFCLLEYIS